ncbi:MAG TPA: RNA polymerase factor sigma-32 [Candidatus Binataceae bacterium]|nr:RNA polymerase factor sigma-32 [Candidatus Binataceae bacterium]
MPRKPSKSKAPPRGATKSRPRSEPAPRPAGATPETGAEEPAIEVEEFHPVAANDDGEIETDTAAPIHTFDDDDHEADDAGSADSEAEDSSALVAFDPLSRYLAEIRRFPLLTREEEAQVARRYADTHDQEDAYRLVTANLRLVVKIAYEFARASRNVLDLVQEGNVGLMEAVKKFDPSRGIRFPSYAVWWIRAYIYRYLLNNWRLVKIGTTQAQRKLFFNLRKESERLEAEGFKPQPLLLAQRMGVKESEVREMQERMAQSEISLDQPLSGGEDTSLLDVLPDTGTPEQETADAEFREFAREKVEKFAAQLKDKELEIFKARLLAEDPMTLQEIGERHGISRERVRQIETRLKRRLKDFLKAEAADIEDAGTS